jgi:hypothetical protein
MPTPTPDPGHDVPTPTPDPGHDVPTPTPDPGHDVPTPPQTVRHTDSDTFFTKEVDMPPVSPTSFELQLPGDLKDTYSGKYVNLAYHLQASADVIAFGNTTVKEFRLIGSSKRPPSGSKMYLNGKNGVVEAVAEINSSSFSPGDTLSGNITLKNLENTNIQTGEVTLRGLEFASADNISRTSTMEEHKTNIRWNSRTTGSFDFQIPAAAKKSYTGKYSKYYWEIEVYLMTGFSSSDIRVSNNLEVN